MTREYRAYRSNLPGRFARRTRTVQERKRRFGAKPAYLQRQLGNRGTQSWINLQTRLTVGAPGDRYEREADAVAKQVASGSPASRISPAYSVARPLSPGLQTAIETKRRGGVRSMAFA